MSSPVILPDTTSADRTEFTPMYNVVLLDDNDHTYDYVIEMLQRLFVLSFEQAYRHAEEVDRCGRTVVITCDLPAAEFSRDQIHAYGPDWRLARPRAPCRPSSSRPGRAHD